MVAQILLLQRTACGAEILLTCTAGHTPHRQRLYTAYVCGMQFEHGSLQTVTVCAAIGSAGKQAGSHTL
jgi:hypothetical protein